MKICKEVKIRKDKSDRNTRDKVLDQKTLIILQKLLDRQKLVDLQGSICSGKEANIYVGQASTDLYSKYIKNVHTAESNNNKTVFCAKKLHEVLKSAEVENTKDLIQTTFSNQKEVETLSKRKMRKINKIKKQMKNGNVNDDKVHVNTEEIERKLAFISINQSANNKTVGNYNAAETRHTTCSGSNQPECGTHCNDGCASSYKNIDDEKNVNALNKKDEEDMTHVAIKIYKTSAMLFKDRERYLEGEKRFKNFCTKNSRKLIRLWAEKEVRNLKRLNKNNVLSPVPIYLKRNVLIMSLIGDPAPKLKDAFIEDTFDCYNQVIRIMEDMYTKCNLIHADLSEYNLLYHDKSVYVIDVGQSVERDHINAMEFLITDIYNVNAFFKKIGVTTIGINELFVQITKTEIPGYLKDWDINKKTFIPSKLDDIANYEDVKIFTGKNDDCYDEESTYDKMEICSDNDSNKLDKKSRKKLVKEFNRERRAYRISKTEKKRIFKRYIGKKNKK